MTDFLQQNVFPFIYKTETLAEKVNLAVGKYNMRLTFRFINNSLNSDTQTNRVFEGRHNIYVLEDQLFDNDQQFEITSPQL